MTIERAILMSQKGEKDPFYSNVSLLLPMTGGNNSTTFTDYSKYATAITPINGAFQTAATYKFPPSSGYMWKDIYFGDKYLTLSNTNFAFGMADWTIELWLYYNASATAFGTFFDNGGQGLFFSYGSYVTNLLLYGATAQSNNVGLPHGMSNGTWNFIAAVRNGSTITVYVNGSSIGSYTGITGSFSPTGATAFIGQFSGVGYSPDTYLQDLRITNGVARYTANFTPPTALFPTS